MRYGYTMPRAATHTARPDSRRSVFLPAVLLFAAAILLVSAAPMLRPSTAEARSINAYRGLGAWIDIYDPSLWNDPVGTVRTAHRQHVRTLYIETANYHAPSAVFRPTQLGQMIEAAHARNMRVVAWYLPGFKDLGHDLRRCLAAVRFRTPGGQRFDSFALDIEASIVKNAATRSKRLVTLSSRLRAKVGRKYTLGAIIPSPVGMRLHASYWPAFPYRKLPRYYDVILPMGYHTFHVGGYQRTYNESRENIRIVREQTGRAWWPIHLIGGLAADTSNREMQAFVRATREYGIIGASTYDMGTSGSEDWRQLRLVRTNPRQRPVLPRTRYWSRALGNIPKVDRTHPKEVFYETGAIAAGAKLRYRVFDCQKGEVRLLVNWHDLGRLPTGRRNRWSGLRTVSLPARVLNQDGRNVIAFVARGTYPKWTKWGVRDVKLIGADVAAAAAGGVAAGQPSGSRWLVYLVVGGTLVVSLGGFIFLKISDRRDRRRDDDDV